MLKNPLYLYGSKDILVPVHLNFGEFIIDKLWTYREKVAVINGATDEFLTFGDILQQAMNFSISLARMGVRKGDVIALCSENREEFWGAVIGVICSGAVLSTVSTAYVEGEIKHAMSISKPKYVISSPSFYKSHEVTLKSFNHVKKIIIFGDEKPNNTLLYKDMAVANGVFKNVNYDDFKAVDVIGQKDTLFILYSSGTTGLPKGVMLSHLNVLTACSVSPSNDPNAVTIGISPWYHVMGLVGGLLSFSCGRTSVYTAKFNVELFMKNIEKYRTQQLTVVPPVLVAVCKSTLKSDLSSVRVIYSGAAPLHKETVEALYEKFPNLQGVLQGYGASETTLAICRFDKVVSTKPGSVGRAAPGVVLKVVDIETRKPLGPNQQGEICAKGELLMKGYMGGGKKDDFDEEGFYRTGDVGYYDDDKYFYICDRLKELIKYKGYQVPPAELEAVLLQHEAISDAGVVGIPNKAAGEVPMAFVVLQPGKTATEEEIKFFIAKRLSNPKRLRGGVKFINAIPKNASGKILRKELRKMAKSVSSKL
ncbi:4-coumarate--CoA ligase 1 [Manduca sexta]|uniref:Luciferin 4-monooxygenase n=1 Tax=Manduca sexta TaxID=7130 RepID=A0A922CGC9_MANSE|nr:4-coumarate--CoA ligase 1 [Manduca sexta]KAG6445161.1 hypothetical protein O3G_MSEX003792 [Manduca sexta]